MCVGRERFDDADAFVQACGAHRDEKALCGEDAPDEGSAPGTIFEDCEKIRDCPETRALCEPSWSGEAMEVDFTPVGGEVIGDHAGEVGVFPFGATHDVVVVVAESVTFESCFDENLCIVVAIVRDIANMQDPWPSGVASGEVLDPCLPVGVRGRGNRAILWLWFDHDW